MPLSLPSPSNAAILDKWGDQALEELIPARYPNLGVIEAQTQSLKVKHYVRENKEQFFDKDKAKLRITGPGSIFEALFTGSGPSDIRAYLQIADESIATRVNQSDTERGEGKWKEEKKEEKRKGGGKERKEEGSPLNLGGVLSGEGSRRRRR